MCMLMLSSPAWQRLTPDSSMAQNEGDTEKHRKSLRVEVLGRSVDCFNLLTAELCRDIRNDLHLGELFLWLVLFTLTAVSIFTGGRDTSDQRGAEDLSREGFNPRDYDRYSW